MDLGKQLENAPKNLVLYVLGLIGAVVDDYVLVTLLVFCILLGFVLSSVLIPFTVFFGAYFVMRLVICIVDALVFNANATASAGHNQAQANLQIANALAQFHPPSDTVMVDETGTSN